ncbi:MAG: hypothetical protein JWL66_2300 [Sphingomonadales bacterium]|nr:hypothetical protein [Sphingomonadales bacterium]
MIKAQTMKQMRRVHHFIGVFFTPAILLFAFSGALQTFRLQEAKGYGGTPPSWIVWMASVHKDQALPRQKAESPKSEQPPVAQPAARPAVAKNAEHARPSTLPLKIFVTFVSIGLILSSLIGVIIALNNRTTRRTSIVMLIAGAIIPLVLLAI